MSASIPGGWEAILLTLGSFRIWRLLAADTILDRPRDWLTRREQYFSDETQHLYRENLDKFLHCPWCLGFWITLATWGAWLAWPQGTLIGLTPWAISAGVGLVQRNWDP